MIVETKINAIKANMLADLDKRWACFADLYLVAALLDPRTKNLSGLKQAEQQKARKLVERLYQEKISLIPPSRPPPPCSSFAPPKRKLEDLLQPSSDTQNQNAELESYLQIEQHKASTNAFKWWHNRKDQFPILSSIALEKLSIPASSAVVERAFSKTRTVVHERNKSLTKSKANTKCYCSLQFSHAEALVTTTAFIVICKIKTKTKKY
jgi:hypothetical protein